MHSLILGLLLWAQVVNANIGAFPNICAGESKSATTVLPVEIKMPSSYGVAAVFTDWRANTTTLIEESRLNSSYFIKTSSKDTNLKWSTLWNKLVLTNNTGCSVVNESALFALPIDLTGTLPLNVSSLSSIVESIVDKKISGFNSYVRVVSGVEGVGWFGCLNVTSSTAVVAVEVVYAGTDSFNPPSSAFKNPLVLSIALSFYDNGTDVNSTMKHRVSLDFEPFRQVTDIQSYLEIDHGLVCEGLDNATAPIDFPDVFQSVYVKEDKSGSVSGRIHYDSRNNMSAESVTIKGQAILFNETFENTTYLVAHDIARKTEFIFSSSPSCISRSLPHSTKDHSSNKLEDAINLFIPNFFSLQFALYSNTTKMDSSISQYRAKKDGKVVEITIVGTDLSAVATYAESKLESILHITSFGKGFERSQDSLEFMSKLNGCFKRSSNLVFFTLKDVTQEKFGAWREDVVSFYMGQTLSNLSNVTISPYRFSFFFNADEKNENTRVILRVADGWEGTTEMTSAQFIDVLNHTLPNGISFVLLEKETWKTTGDFVLPYPPPPPSLPPSFNGYTGGSMFVLGVFMILLGVAVGAGGVFVVLRKQRISTLAYQVFE